MIERINSAFMPLRLDEHTQGNILGTSVHIGWQDDDYAMIMQVYWVAQQHGRTNYYPSNQGQC